jgi:hypothetical protein
VLSTRSGGLIQSVLIVGILVTVVWRMTAGGEAVRGPGRRDDASTVIARSASDEAIHVWFAAALRDRHGLPSRIEAGKIQFGNRGRPGKAVALHLWAPAVRNNSSCCLVSTPSAVTTISRWRASVRTDATLAEQPTLLASPYPPTRYFARGRFAIFVPARPRTVRDASPAIAAP